MKINIIITILLFCNYLLGNYFENNILNGLSVLILTLKTLFFIYNDYKNFFLWSYPIIFFIYSQVLTIYLAIENRGFSIEIGQYFHYNTSVLILSFFCSICLDMIFDLKLLKYIKKYELNITKNKLKKFKLFVVIYILIYGMYLFLEIRTNRNILGDRAQFYNTFRYLGFYGLIFLKLSSSGVVIYVSFILGMIYINSKKIFSVILIFLLIYLRILSGEKFFGIIPIFYFFLIPIVIKSKLKRYQILKYLGYTTLLFCILFYISYSNYLGAYGLSIQKARKLFFIRISSQGQVIWRIIEFLKTENPKYRELYLDMLKYNTKLPYVFIEKFSPEHIKIEFFKKNIYFTGYFPGMLIYYFGINLGVIFGIILFYFITKIYVKFFKYLFKNIELNYLLINVFIYICYALNYLELITIINQIKYLIVYILLYKVLGGTNERNYISRRVWNKTIVRHVS